MIVSFLAFLQDMGCQVAVQFCKMIPCGTWQIGSEESHCGCELLRCSRTLNTAFYNKTASKFWQCCLIFTSLYFSCKTKSLGRNIDSMKQSSYQAQMVQANKGRLLAMLPENALLLTPFNEWSLLNTDKGCFIGCFELFCMIFPVRSLVTSACEPCLRVKCLWPWMHNNCIG